MNRPLGRRVPVLPTSALALALALGGCSGGGDDDPGSAPSDAASQAAPGDDVALARVSPCPAIGETAVTDALGDELAGGTTWADGERAPLAAGLSEVAQEAGCVFRGEEGTAARAWVFAPPVTPGRARAVVRTLRTEQGCREAPEAPGFGTPGVARTCARGDTRVASFGGLYGNAWLGCSVSVPRSAARGPEGREALVRRAEQWCSEVFGAARAATEETSQDEDAGDGS